MNHGFFSDPKRAAKLFSLEGILGLLETPKIFSYGLERHVSREACISDLERDTAKEMGSTVSSAFLPDSLSRDC